MQIQAARSAGRSRAPAEPAWPGRWVRPLRAAGGGWRSERRERSLGEAGGYASCSKNRWASSAAMQPVPALVMAWR